LRRIRRDTDVTPQSPQSLTDLQISRELVVSGAIQAKGFQQRCETDADFALTMKMLPALAFVPVPPTDVVATFNELVDRGE